MRLSRSLSLLVSLLLLSSRCRSASVQAPVVPSAQTGAAGHGHAAALMRRDAEELSAAAAAGGGSSAAERVVRETPKASGSEATHVTGKTESKLTLSATQHDAGGAARRAAPTAGALLQAATKVVAERPLGCLAAAAGMVSLLGLALWYGRNRPSSSDNLKNLGRGRVPGSSTDGEKTEDASIYGALGYAVVWMILSATLTLHNAWMFSATGGHFPYVITLTCWHMGLNTCLALLVRLLCPSLMPAATRLPMPITAVIRAVAIPALLLTTTLALGNRAYLYLSVSLIQMVKAGMPMLVYLVSCILGVEAVSSKVAGAVVAILVGVSMTVMGEIQLNLTGLAILGVSSVAESFRLVSLKLMLSSKGISLDPLSGLLFYAPMCFVSLFILGIATGEFRNAMLVSNPPIAQLLLNGGVACGLNLASVFLLQKASATTLTVCGVVKDGAIVALSLLLLQNTITPLQIVGFMITVAAVRLYNQLKEAKPKQ
eukprot:TRINITY_DN24765_c0_g3_i1.p1 TRINITY_DN24765_c0_g3~~TRINITY_DN24765_c0_g3_i1.p1  ORF type:complete len:486 (-),score=126.83 TRINITY_DN24765_c0_g3_i1:200-1657(-)